MADPTFADCKLCGQPLERSREKIVYEITGWEEPRRQGGANKIIGRKVTGFAAHKTCVQSPGQATLL